MPKNLKRGHLGSFNVFYERIAGELLAGRYRLVIGSACGVFFQYLEHSGNFR